MTESWYFDIFRGLFAMLDNIAYKFLGYFYEIMTEISKVMVISSDQSNAFATKIYTLLGIFMLFKITFSLINYIVNPDAMNDKTKGVGKIAVNIVIVLVLIIITPTAFAKMYQLQNAIITDDIIPRFILGNVSESSLGKNQLYFSEEYCGTGAENAITASSDGQYIALMTFRTFFQPEKKEMNSDILDKYCNTDNNSVSDYLDPDIYNAAPGLKAKYEISYNLLISTAVGVVVLLLFLSFSIDIAVRSIKLSFLQIISPVPIISYIDPESGKKGMFGKWLKDVGKTWADLFIRLIAIYFAVYIIGLIGNNGFSLKDFNGNELALNHKYMVGLFIIIGALVFAKRLPTIITDLTGIKLGGMQLNPFKKIEKEALGGKALAGGATAALALPGVAGGFAYNKFKGKSTLGSLGAAVGALGNAKKAPGTWKGLTAGISPAIASKKKELEEKDKNRESGKKVLKDINKMNEEGSAYFESAKKMVDGKPVFKTEEYLDKNGNIQTRETNEYEFDEGKLFKNQVFKDSYGAVAASKKAVGTATNEAKRAQVLYQDAVTRYGTDDSRTTFAYNQMSVAEKAVKGAEGNLELNKKIHDANRSIYADDAKIEDTFSTYKKTHAKEVSPDGANPNVSKQEEKTETPKVQNSNIIKPTDVSNPVMSKEEAKSKIILPGVELSNEEIKKQILKP